MEMAKEGNDKLGTGNKKRPIIEVTLCILGMAALTFMMAVFGADAGLLAGIAAYWIPCAVLLLCLQGGKTDAFFCGSETDSQEACL